MLLLCRTHPTRQHWDHRIRRQDNPSGQHCATGRQQDFKAVSTRPKTCDRPLNEHLLQPEVFDKDIAEVLEESRAGPPDGTVELTDSTLSSREVDQRIGIWIWMVDAT
jgi:hypothetical protein